MQIHWNSLSHSIFAGIQEKIIHPLTDQQKRVFLVASVVFACLAAYYVIRHCCFTAEISNEEEDGDLPAGEKEVRTRVIKGILYEGRFQHGKLNGQGTITHPDGKILEGNFKDNYLHGQGKITHKGVVEHGEFKEGIFIQGKRTFDSTSSFYQKGYKEEEGRFNRINEYSHETLLVEGKRVLSNDLIEEGRFKRFESGSSQFNDRREHNELDGKGKQTHNGTTWDGIFYQGRLVKGTITHPDKTIEEGTFIEFDKLIKGKMSHPTGVVEEGEFKDKKLHGRGKRTDLDNMTWEGEFTDGKLIHAVKKIQADGTILEGEFKNDELEGAGTITHMDGTLVMGTFQNGQLEGAGTITYPNKTVKKVIFKAGKPINESEK